MIPIVRKITKIIHEKKSKDIVKLLGHGSAFVITKLLTMVFLVCVSFVILYPFIYMMSTVFRVSEDMLDPNVTWIPTQLTLQNIVGMWRQIKFPSLLLSTVVLCAGSALLQTCVCMISGYGLARFRFRGKRVLWLLLLLSIVIPPQITSIPNYLQMIDFDIFGLVAHIEEAFHVNITIRLFDTAAVYYLPAVFGVGIRSGLFIMIASRFFEGLPEELEDSAYVDGAGPGRTFLRIMLPNAKPVVVVILLFSLVWYWNDTYYGYMYLDELQTLTMRLERISTDLPYLVADIAGIPSKAVPYEQAGILLCILPVLVLYLFCQRVFVESVERTGIVG